MTYSEKVIAELRERYADQPEFLQAATEVLETIQLRSMRTPSLRSSLCSSASSSPSV